MLTNRQIFILADCALLAAAFSDVLSEFEQEVVREVCGRFCEQQRAAIVTEPEWLVIEDARSAMWGALERDMADSERAAA
ncbi:MAG: hypothetical protein ACXW3D_01210 [Caulobacteraceae bacterium]